MKESLTTATPKGNKGIFDDCYSKRMITFIYRSIIPEKGKELVVCNVMMYALRNDVLKINEICVICILYAYAMNVVEM